MITEWNQRQMIAKIAGKVVDGMDAACSFAAEQARANAPIRRGILKSDIDYKVTAQGTNITGYVGVKTGKAFYAIFVERGTRKMAAHPFLRPAVFSNAKEILKLVAGKR